MSRGGYLFSKLFDMGKYSLTPFASTFVGQSDLIMGIQLREMGRHSGRERVLQTTKCTADTFLAIHLGSVIINLFTHPYQRPT